MAENKTKPTNVSVDQFLRSVTDETKREDSRTLIKLMKAITGEEPQMWGPTMIGFGTHHYVYASGREGDIFRTGFSPRKTALTIYLACEFADRFTELVARLGKAKMGKGCLYIKNLGDIDLKVLQELIETSLGS